MIWTAWNNGEHHETGAGYGFKLSAEDRDRYFRRPWPTVSIELPLGETSLSVEVSVDKRSFWGPQCRELINKEIGRWMLDEGLAPWQKGSPPKLDAEWLGGRRFRVCPG